MVAVCFYFQVHQPFRLRPAFDFFSIGSDQPFEDEATNREIAAKVAQKCYLPTNALMLELIEKHKGKFRIAYSISGTALEQFEAYEPSVIASFKRLVDTGCVEILGETYYHSLAFLFSDEEFRRQVRLHKAKIKKLFGVVPKTLRNTELIYDNRLARIAQELGFKAILAEGADQILGWRSPNYVYRPKDTPKVALLVKNYRLSDDIAFRFSNRDWSCWPLTAEKYAGWLHQFAGQGQTVNLFLDYETFGEHQWEETGIFKFLRHLPEAILAHSDFRFMTPAEVAKTFEPVGELDVSSPISWADTERDVSAWLGNHMQDGAADGLYALEKELIALKDETLLHTWRKLQTSDHFYYMCTKHFYDGAVHRYFSPYSSPYDSFIHFANALNQLKWLISKARGRRSEAKKLARSASAAEAAARQSARQSALPGRQVRPELPSPQADADGAGHPFLAAAER